MSKRECVSISLWYNYGDRSSEGNSLAVPSMPELGDQPHAQKLMRALGIDYEECSAHPISDSWVFRGINKRPEVVEPYMSFFTEPTNDR